eukprot:2933393-Pleurochrysis_carterae.AAC.1
MLLQTGGRLDQILLHHFRARESRGGQAHAGRGYCASAAAAMLLMYESAHGKNVLEALIVGDCLEKTLSFPVREIPLAESYFINGETKSNSETLETPNGRQASFARAGDLGEEP